VVAAVFLLDQRVIGVLASSGGRTLFVKGNGGCYLKYLDTIGFVRYPYASGLRLND
jgi:hypothetical protein